MSAPVPLVLFWVLNWVGLGWTGLGLGLGGFGNKGLGPGLDNTLFHFNFEKGVLGRHITICVLNYWFNTILK